MTASGVAPIAYAAEELDPFLAQFKATAEPQLLVAPSPSAPIEDVPPTVQNLLARSRTQGHGHGHNSVLRAAAALLARGLGDDCVVEICGPFCTGGASDPELQAFIASAVSKGFMGQSARSPQDIVLTTPQNRTSSASWPCGAKGSVWLRMSSATMAAPLRATSTRGVEAFNTCQVLPAMVRQSSMKAKASAGSTRRTKRAQQAG